LQVVIDYDWPGNVRELENTIEREFILCKGKPLHFDQLVVNRFRSSLESHVDNYEKDLCLENVIKSHIKKVLALTNGQVGGKKGAAELLRVHPSTLRSRMRKLGIK
jgi:DNA-binding NtrC family response regulator